MDNERRKCELYLVRLVPHPLRDDFMTVGVVLVESRQPSPISYQESPHPTNTALGGAPGLFADIRFTKDWKRVECFAPDLELEILEYLEATVRDALKEKLLPQGAQGSSTQYPAPSSQKEFEPLSSQGGIRQQLSEILEHRFGALFDVGPVKAVETRDPTAEMQVIARDYLEPMQPVERARRMGRTGIVSRMQDAFAQAGVLELLQRDIEMKEFTGENDPFKVDFGFRVGSTLKMFHGLALSLSREPAVTLAYRYGRIREGMRARGDEALLTAVISEEAMKIPTQAKTGLPLENGKGDRSGDPGPGWGTRRGLGDVASGVAMLRASEIRVRGVEEVGEIAEEVRREVTGS